MLEGIVTACALRLDCLMVGIPWAVEGPHVATAGGGSQAELSVEYTTLHQKRLESPEPESPEAPQQPEMFNIEWFLQSRSICGPDSVDSIQVACFGLNTRLGAASKQLTHH